MCYSVVGVIIYKLLSIRNHVFIQILLLAPVSVDYFLHFIDAWFDFGLW